MSIKLVQTFKTDLEGVYACLYRDSEWQEWQVCLHKKSDARHKPETVYFTSDKSDAINQAHFLVKEVNAKHAKAERQERRAIAELTEYRAAKSA